MRLIEFADDKPYTLSADDTADFLKQLERIWPHEDVAFVLGVKKPALDKHRRIGVL